MRGKLACGLAACGFNAAASECQRGECATKAIAPNRVDVENLVREVMSKMLAQKK
jgi:hypothetical protein